MGEAPLLSTSIAQFCTRLPGWFSKTTKNIPPLLKLFHLSITYRINSEILKPGTTTHSTPFTLESWTIGHCLKFSQILTLPSLCFCCFNLYFDHMLKSYLFYKVWFKFHWYSRISCYLFGIQTVFIMLFFVVDLFMSISSDSQTAIFLRSWTMGHVLIIFIYFVTSTMHYLE